MSVVIHVRQRMRRRRGNRFYKDHSVRPTSTFCGAPVTEYDAAWADRHRVEPFDDKVVCPDCVAKVTE